MSNEEMRNLNQQILQSLQKHMMAEYGVAGQILSVQNMGDTLLIQTQMGVITLFNNGNVVSLA
jgi:hypothetical protein